MRYAICYVSTAKEGISDQEIEEILNNSEENNNKKDITGLLLYSEGNFFQVIEGVKEDVKTLYERIKRDKRHSNVIKLFETSIHKPSFDGYRSDLVTETTKFNPVKMQDYRHHLEVLDPKTKQAVENVLRAFIY
ncbi:BLUF domain-containing protein [Gramella sp. KN1008]|uniref:BLUF domain-containing protein n=1 Tax=Gramella sp. KN1008 TaxID=2529298 RepID=UPI00103CDE07|nr:BLUF domain-containing protein [Gramella sp. KN1008]TBW30361.1 BLUF domain-containing protein [Gramella sp. KN1008]